MIRCNCPSMDNSSHPCPVNVDSIRFVLKKFFKELGRCRCAVFSVSVLTRVREHPGQPAFL